MGDKIERNLQVLKSCFEAVGAGDADRLVGHYTEDYVLELPFKQVASFVRIEGREEVRRYLREAFDLMRFSLTLSQVYPTEEPDLLLVEYTSAGKCLATGKPYHNRYFGLWWFRDGRVSRTREYSNPVASREARSPD